MEQQDQPAIAHPSLARLLFRYASEEKRYSVDATRIHASDLYDLCFRQVFLLRESNTAFYRIIPPGVRMKFEFGKALEAVIVGWLNEMGVLKTVQPEFAHEQLGIVAHPDGELMSGHILEVKGMDPALFRLARRYPLPRHKFQVETYLWLAKRREAVLFSATWGNERQPFRDQIVHYNLKVGEVITRQVSRLREAEAGGPPPDRICQTLRDARALTCPVAERCFAQDSVRLERTIGKELGYEK